jgi:GT2 family glycosyltransferase
LQSINKSPKACICILNWNGKRHLRDCLDSVISQTYGSFEVLVVDNASTDGSVSFIQDNYPSVNVLVLSKNYGFSCAYNIAFRKITQEGSFKYVIILNNDTLVTNCWLEKLIIAAEKDACIGSCASKILRFDEPSLLENAGFTLYNDGSPMLNGSGMDARTFSEDTEVFGAMGAAALYKIDMLKDVSLNDEFFDPDFFAYNEEFDLAWRAKLRGWKCIYVPAIVYHKGRASFGKTPRLVTYLHERNKVWALVKNVPNDLVFYCLPNFILHEIITFLFHVYAGDLPAVFHAHFSSFLGMRKMISKRKKIQQNSSVNSLKFKSYMSRRNYLILFKEAFKPKN